MRIEQARLGGRQLIKDPLGNARELSQLVGPHVGRLPLGGVADDLGIGLEAFHAQQPIMIRRLVLGRNAQPAMIRIECTRHVDPLATKMRFR